MSQTNCKIFLNRLFSPSFIPLRTSSVRNLCGFNGTEIKQRPSFHSICIRTPSTKQQLIHTQPSKYDVIQRKQRRLGHSVRVILTSDLAEGKGYVGDVLSVKAGYARNDLIPQKKAVYATPENLARFGLEDVDKDFESSADREDEVEISDDQKQADILRHYLRNKILKLWRNIDGHGKMSPGMVDAKAIRRKLSKQLKIDLDNNERVKINPEPVTFLDIEEKIDDVLDEMGEYDEVKDADVQIRALGDYVAKIYLEGGFSALLKFTVMKR